MKLVISAAVLTALAVVPAFAQSSSSAPSGSMGGSSSTMGSSGTSGSASLSDQSATWESNSSLVMQVEQKLKDQGLSVSSADGKLDQSERDALKQFQSKKGISQSGKIDQATLSALDINPQTAASPSGSMPSTSGSPTMPSPTPPSGTTR